MLKSSAVYIGTNDLTERIKERVGMEPTELHLDETTKKKRPLVEATQLNLEKDSEDAKDRPAYIHRAGGIPSVNKESLSDLYSKRIVQQVINGIIDELLEWEKIGTKEGLINIVNIQNILKSQKHWFYKKSELRILASLTSIIFENNNWSKIKPSQLRFVRGELKRFKDGLVSHEALENFAQQIQRSDLQFFGDIDTNTYDEETDNGT